MSNENPEVDFWFRELTNHDVLLSMLCAIIGLLFGLAIGYALWAIK